MAKRVSLTKLQRQSAAGAELIALCRDIADDGRLSIAEIDDLKNWIDAYATEPLPAREYLDATLQRVLADGTVTPAELRELFTAIEKILPPDIRSDVVARRKGQDLAEEHANAPIDGWDFMVAGCRYEGRPALIEAYCTSGERIFLVREPSNVHSHYAIEVRVASGHQIGYVPEADARDMATLLDKEHPYRASIKKVLTGGRAPIPVVIADFYSHASDVTDLTRSQDVPARAATSKGCGLLLVAGIAGLGTMVAGF